MARKKAADRRASTPSRAPQAAATRKDNLRETIESIVIAFVLAFLFRTFEVEPFVIPTGSMAPTLMGQHYDVDCEKCGYRYQINASEEVDETALDLKAAMHKQPDAELRRRSAVSYKQRMVAAGTCPICRFTMDLDPQGTPKSFKGDRIIVAKFAYEFRDPDRWDVAVFKFPGEAKTNYIKRIAGLPNETVRLNRGDLFTKPVGADAFSIARKPAYKQRAMAQIVHDNDFESPALAEAGWPSRWQSGQWSDTRGTLAFAPGGDRAGGWTSDDGHRSFTSDGTAADDVWLRYQHIVPNDEVWREVLVNGSVADTTPRRPQLITDFYAYNTKVSVQEQLALNARGARQNPVLVARHAEGFGLHWVGDVMLEAEVEVTSDAGEIVLELVEGSVVAADGTRQPARFQCFIDVATGQARLAIAGPEVDYAPRGQTNLTGPGTYRLALSNFDDQLTLWVDGSPVAFDAPTEFGPLGNFRPTTADLAPVGIAARGAPLTVRHLRVRRDVYYIAAKNQAGDFILTDYAGSNDLLVDLNRRKLESFLATPDKWATFDRMRSVEFALGPDDFLALGDNSPRSQDSRLWGPRYQCESTVHRELLIGEALFIYWPHSWFFPIPAVQDMGLVR